MQRNNIYRVRTPLILADGCEKTCILKDNTHTIPIEGSSSFRAGTKTV